MTSRISFWPFVCLLLAATCLVLWFARGCNSKKDTPISQPSQQLQDSLKSIQKNYSDELVYIAQLQDDSSETAIKLVADSAELKKAKSEIYAGNKTGTALANDLADAKLRLDTFRYIRDCDSLGIVTKKAKPQIDSLFRVIHRLGNTQLELSTLANKTKDALRQQIAGCQSAVGLLQKENARVEQLVQPHNKVFIGLEGFTCPAASGVGPGLIYENKKEQLFGLSGGIATTGSYWIGLKAYIKIKL